MNFRIAFQILLLILVFNSCDKGSDGSCYNNPGARSLMHNGQERSYFLHLPSNYNDTIATPLFLNFHGFGGSASDFMNEVDMSYLADQENFILVYPQGTCLEGFSHWNTSLPGINNKSEADDFNFIEALLDQISLEYNVDRERIYACGYSNGGMFAYGLANFRSDLIAAVASVSGTMVDFNGTTSHPMPVLHLHGTSDLIIPYEGNSDYNSAQTVLEHWVNFNNTINNPTLITDSNGGMTIEHYVYDQGDNNVSVEHYKYIGGEHIWFNATFQGMNTARLIWNFVSRYDIHGLR